MLTQASKYAIRAVLFLAKNGSAEKRYGAREIAQELDIPYAFIAKLLQKLARKNLISSLKGPGGGFYLSEDNLSNNICQVLENTESGKVFEGCFLALPVCGDQNPCPVHHIVSPFREALLEKFQTQKIKEFAKEVEEKGSYLSLKNINT